MEASWRPRGCSCRPPPWCPGGPCVPLSLRPAARAPGNAGHAGQNPLPTWAAGHRLLGPSRLSLASTQAESIQAEIQTPYTLPVGHSDPRAAWGVELGGSRGDVLCSVFCAASVSLCACAARVLTQLPLRPCRPRSPSRGEGLLRPGATRRSRAAGAAARPSTPSPRGSTGASCAGR